jgi:hypothetical protein
MIGFFEEQKNVRSLMRLQSFICFLLFCYLTIFQFDVVRIEVFITVGVLAFGPKALQKYFEKKVNV